VRDAGEIERAVAAFAQSPNGGLILTMSGLAVLHRDLIDTLAAPHGLPAVYFERFSPPAAWSLTDLIKSISTGKRPVMSTASSRAKSPLTCRSNSP
jgi:hypothetical protein